MGDLSHDICFKREVGIQAKPHKWGADFHIIWHLERALQVDINFEHKLIDSGRYSIYWNVNRDAMCWKVECATISGEMLTFAVDIA